MNPSGSTSQQQQQDESGQPTVSATCSSNSMDSSARTVAGVELPSLKDRKCFLTCLACLLTSTYIYDVKEEIEKEIEKEPNTSEDASSPPTSTTTTTINTTITNDTTSDKDKHFVSNAGGETGLTSNTTNTGTRSESQQRRHSQSSDDDDDDDDMLDIPGGKLEISMFLDDYDEEVLGMDMSAEEQDDVENEDGQSEEKEINEEKEDALSTTANSKSGGGGPASRWRRRFGRGNMEEGKKSGSNSGKNDKDNDVSSSDPNQTSNGKGNKKHSKGKVVTASERKQRQKRVTKAQRKLQLASQRHYLRRYCVADQLLQTSCDHLLLDKSESKQLYDELAPKLQVLKAPRLVPRSDKTTGTCNTVSDTSTNGTGNFSSTPESKVLGKRWSSFGAISNKHGSDNAGSGSELETESDATKEANNLRITNNGNNNRSSSSNRDNEIGDEQVPTATPTQEQPADDPREWRIQQQYLTQKEWMTEYDDQLAIHLPNLSPGAGYRCVCWLLFQHLINATKRGYDARVRFIFKSLAVAVILQDIERTLEYTGDDYIAWKTKNYTTWVSFATRKFDQIEAGMSDRLLALAQQQQAAAAAGDPQNSGMESDEAVVLEDLEAEDEDEIQVVTVKKNKKKLAGARKHIVRGLKIGGVGVVAGTLLAVTGGMAAPAIAGALTFLGMGAVAGTFLSLASTTAVVHLFGVAGGSLAAYKMRRRTAGLTEFTIVQSTATTARQNLEEVEASNDDLLPGEKEQLQSNQTRLGKWKNKAKAFTERRMHQSDDKKDASPTKAELSRTICISGWLTDNCDFQRPWGIAPSKPPPSKLEKLQRFYRVYNPDLIPVCDNLLKRWKKEESTFWELLEDKYGCNPDNLFPLRFGPMHDAKLTGMELAVLDKLIVEIGEVKGKQKEAQHAHLPEHIQGAIAADSTSNATESHDGTRPGLQQTDSTRTLGVGDDESVVTADGENMEDQLPQRFQRQCYASVFEQVAPSSSLENLIPPDHLVTVWDFSSRYGGEVYTLHWETHMLTKLCLCFRDVALTTAASAGQQALRLMVANTIALAASVPIYLLQAMNSIDETWSVVVSRAEAAGKELAKSLLVNNAGHRPVTLLGYSFGARVVFSCLKQLAVYQQQWEDYHELKAKRAIGFASHEESHNTKRKEKKWMLHELEFDREPASVVEDAVIIGAPMYLSLSSWKACRQVVAGRFVNVYSRTDKILSLMFKYKQMMESFKPVCGNCTIAVPGVENIDVSDLVGNHQEYVLKVGDIMKRVRHEQPVRSSTNALDELALIAEAKLLVKQQNEAENAESKAKS